MEPDGIEAVIELDIPQQTNGFDCGIFVCKYAEHITRNVVIDFEPTDGKIYRRNIRRQIKMCSLI